MGFAAAAPIIAAGISTVGGAAGGGKGGGKGGGGFDFPDINVQELVNQQLDLNRSVVRENQLFANPNTFGPFGSTTTTFDPTTGQPTITTQPLPGVEDLINSQIAQRQQISDLARQNFFANDSLLRDALDEEGVEELVDIKGGLPPVLTSFNDGAGLSRIDESTIPTFADVNLLDAINTLGISDLPTLGQFQGLADEATDAVFNQFDRLTRDRFRDQEEALQQDLANRGLPVGSEAQSTSLRNFRDDVNRARLNAADQAVLTGEQRRFNLLAQALGIRAQDFGERTTEANFTNQSRLSEAALRTSGLQNQLAALGFNNAAAINEANLSNQARQSAIAQALGFRTNALNEIAGLSGQAASFLPLPQAPPFTAITANTPNLLDSQLAALGIQSQNAAALGQANTSAQNAKTGGLADITSTALPLIFRQPTTPSAL